ncbi:MAG: ChaN family lipoprotein [Proteobacteria bacterium]|nr:ChaN family lipoprotein [Pseudomonadota bacterium]
MVVALAVAGCATVTPAAGPFAWEARLRGDAIVLFGEVHDNEVQHRLRLEVLRRAFAAGWRPAIVMEQFDREHQADIERARRERPRDAGYLIEQAAPGQAQARSAWNWAYYRPYVDLALEYDVPLLAGNLSRADAQRIVAQGYAAVFDASARESLGLGRESAELQAAQATEIDNGHCHAIPAAQLPAMARAQLARDAVMADILRARAARGVVLLAGDGHVRRDRGVPRWLEAPMLARTFAIGLLERGEAAPPRAAFDTVVTTVAAPREDPCTAFRSRGRP